MNSSYEISIEEWHKLSTDGSGIPITIALSGNSMRPLITRGEENITIVPVYRRLKKGDIVLFVRRDGAYVCHRIRKIIGDTVTTIGDACYEYDAPLHISQVWGIVTKKEKNGKETKLDSALSRIYGRFWMSLRWLRIIRRDIKRLSAKGEE